ncbi:MAG: MFS transporter, partial [Gammaproteobacteria bacterium]
MVVVVPTLAELARRYSIDYADVQFLISAYLFGLGVAQPFSGWLCDRFGRRRVLLAGFSLFVLASLGCAIAGSFGLLVALRFLQATGVSVGTVASRAILRDIHDEAGTARTLALV